MFENGRVMSLMRTVKGLQKCSMKAGQSLFSLFAHSPAHATRGSRLEYRTRFLAAPPAGILEQKRDCSQSRWTYANVRTKIFRINGLPNFLTHGAPRAPLINPTTELVFCFIEALLADPQWKKVQCSYSHSEFDPRGILITSRTSFSRGLFMSQDPRGRSCHCLFQLYGKKNWKKTLSARTRRKVNYLIL